jgi:hypothetical protein
LAALTPLEDLVDLVAGFLAAFFVDLLEDFLVAAADLRLTAGFFAAGFFAGDFFAVDFFTVAFFVAFFLAAPLLAALRVLEVFLLAAIAVAPSFYQPGVDACRSLFPE